jgi:hypothetical protein
MDDQVVQLLMGEIRACREEVQELRNEFQKAKGVVFF